VGAVSSGRGATRTVRAPGRRRRAAWGQSDGTPGRAPLPRLPWPAHTPTGGAGGAAGCGAARRASDLVAGLTTGRACPAAGKHARGRRGGRSARRRRRCARRGCACAPPAAWTAHARGRRGGRCGCAAGRQVAGGRASATRGGAAVGAGPPPPPQPPPLHPPPLPPPPPPPPCPGARPGVDSVERADGGGRGTERRPRVRPSRACPVRRAPALPAAGPPAACAPPALCARRSRPPPGAGRGTRPVGRPASSRLAGGGVRGSGLAHVLWLVRGPQARGPLGRGAPSALRRGPRHGPSGDGPGGRAARAAPPGPGEDAARPVRGLWRSARPLGRDHGRPLAGAC
jgi:hypothetical protein